MTQPMVTSTLPPVVLDGETIEGPQGIRLYTRAFGDPGAAQRLITIHGGLQSSLCYRKQYGVLAQNGVFVVAWDLPWHGLSVPGLRDLAPTPQIWSESLHAVRRHFGLLERPVYLMAWSFGGYVIRNALLLEGQQGIAGLVLVATLLDMEAFMPLVMGERPRTAELVMQVYTPSLPLDARLAALLAFVEMLCFQPYPSQEDYLLTLGYNLRSFLASEHIIDAILATQAPGDTQRLLQGLRCPALVIQGENDALVPPSYTQRLAEHIPARLRTLSRYPQCGHSPFLEYPDRFNEEVLRFLAQTGGAGRV